MRLIAKTIITVYLLCTLICCGHKQKEATREYSMMQIDSVTCQYRCAMGEGILRLVSVTDSTNRIEHLRGDSVVDSWALDYPVYRFTCGDLTGDSIPEGKTAIILLAQEEYETALTAKLNDFDVTITRLDAAEVAAEVENAREVERQMAKETREKLREEKTEAFKETVAKKSEELKNWFSHLGKGE